MQRTPPPRAETAGPLRSAPSSRPYDTMASSQQSHIDDLIQKNRTLEHMCKKLREELAKSESQNHSLVARHTQQLETMQSKWIKERTEWREGCDAMQNAHKVAHMRTAMLLDAERRNLLEERDVMRRERLAKMQRDYKIVLFQDSENELVSLLEELKDELGEERVRTQHEMNRLVKIHREVVQKWKDKCIGLISRVKEKEGELDVSQNNKAEVDVNISRLQEEVNTLTASNATLATNLERKALQFDRAKTEMDELKHLNADLKDTNADLKRQVDKWLSLDSKEGDEINKLRKQRVELEVRVKELESRLADSEKGTNANNQTLEALNAKIEKVKTRLQQYQTAFQESDETVKEKESQIAELEAQLDRAKEKIGKLKSQLSEERETSKTKKSATPVVRETEVEEEAPQPKARPKPRPVSKHKVDLEGNPSKSKGKEKAVEKEDSDIQEVEGFQKPTTKPKMTKVSESPEKPKQGRSKKAAKNGTEAKPATKGKKGRKAVNNDSDIEVVEKKDKGKGKALREDDDEVVEKPKKRNRSRSSGVSELEAVELPAKKKPNNLALSKAPTQPSISVQASDGEAKKKRKIRILPNQPSAFAWNLAGTEAFGGIVIPRDLSPVKEGELVPARSIFSKSGSTLR